MKTYLIGLALAIVISGATVYSPAKEVTVNTAVDKSISFAVYKASNYTSDAYNQTSARVHIIVEKVNKNKRIIVWEKTFDAQLLKQYPTFEHAISQSITIPNVVDKKEHLEVNYILTYDSKGSQLEMQNGTIVSKDSNSEKLDISI